jgi:hypothetical protein
MSRSRRSNRNGNNGAANGSSSQGGSGGSNGSGGSGRNRNGGKKKTESAAVTSLAFWGDPSADPGPVSRIAMTSDPTVTIRSLGAPPLMGHEVVAEHYFAAVYDKAANLAAALAAAGGVLDFDFD